MRAVSVALLAGLLALGLVACGGDDDEGVSKSEYIKSADALCAEGDKEQEGIVSKAFKDPSNPQPDEAQAVIEQIVPLQKARLAKLRALEKPEDDAATIDAIYAAVDTGIQSLARAAATPETSFAALRAETGPFDAADRLAKDYGMKECGGE